MRTKEQAQAYHKAYWDKHKDEQNRKHRKRERKKRRIAGKIPEMMCWKTECGTQTIMAVQGRKER